MARGLHISEAVMKRALKTTYGYLMGEEGSVGIMTVIVLVLAGVVMLTCMISYPGLAEAFGVAG